VNAKWHTIITEEVVIFNERCIRATGSVQSAKRRLQSFHLNRIRQDLTSFCAENVTVKGEALLKEIADSNSKNQKPPKGGFWFWG